MGHLKKWNKTEAIRIIMHNRRDAEAKGYYRENIDNERSKFNYSLYDGDDNFMKRLNDRGVKVYASNSTKRKPPNYCVSWVITAPPEIIEEYPEREREFFEHCVNFLKERYGEDNTVSAIVHKDEKSPHLHYIFTPVVPDKKDKTKLRLCAKDVVNRQELSVFHKDLQSYIDQKMDMHVSILKEDSASRSNLSINELKLQALLDEQEQIKNDTQRLLDKYKDIENTEKNVGLVSDAFNNILKDYFSEPFDDYKFFGLHIQKDETTIRIQRKDYEAVDKTFTAVQNTLKSVIPLSQAVNKAEKEAAEAAEAQKAAEQREAEEREKVVKLDADLSSEKKKVEALRDDISRLKADIGKLNENLAKEKDTNNNLIYHLSLYQYAPKADLIPQKEAAVYTFSCYLSALTAQLLAFRNGNSDIVSDSMIWEDVGTALYSNSHLNSNKVSELIYNAYLCQLNGQEPSPTDEYREYWSLPYPSTVNLLEEIPPDVFSPSFYMDKDGNSLVDEEFLKRAEALRQSLILLKGKSKDVPKEHEAEHSDNFER